MYNLFTPRITNDTALRSPFERQGLIDQLFNATFPWKVLKSFAPDQTLENPQALLPTVDITSDAKAYTVHAELPGVDKKDVKLEVHDHLLTLTGEKKEEKTSEDEKKAWHLSERCFGSFTRSLQLPEDADIEKITAQHKDGVLTITVPRKTALENKKVIEIKAS